MQAKKYKDKRISGSQELPFTHGVSFAVPQLHGLSHPPRVCYPVLHSLTHDQLQMGPLSQRPIVSFILFHTIAEPHKFKCTITSHCAPESLVIRSHKDPQSRPHILLHTSKHSHVKSQSNNGKPTIPQKPLIQQ